MKLNNLLSDVRLLIMLLEQRSSIQLPPPAVYISNTSITGTLKTLKTAAEVSYHQNHMSWTGWNEAQCDWSSTSSCNDGFIAGLEAPMFHEQPWNSILNRAAASPSTLRTFRLRCQASTGLPMMEPRGSCSCRAAELPQSSGKTVGLPGSPAHFVWA
jgi:hypothetical protein